MKRWSSALVGGLLMPRQQRIGFATNLRVSQLPNGSRVVTGNRNDISSAVAVVLVELGAKYDPLDTPGLSYAMQWSLMAQRRRLNLPLTITEARKRFLSFRMTTTDDSWKEATADLLRTLSIPNFHLTPFDAMKLALRRREEEMWRQFPIAATIDKLETVAFPREPLGSPRIAREEDFYISCSDDAMMQHYKNCMDPQRCVVVGFNMAHYDLLPIVHNCLVRPPPLKKELPISPKSERMQFCGGQEKHIFNSTHFASGEVCAAVGMLSSGADSLLQDFAASLVLHRCFAEMASDVIDPSLGTTFFRPYGWAGLIGAATTATKDTVVEKIAILSSMMQQPLTCSDGLLKKAKDMAVEGVAKQLADPEKEAEFIGSRLQGKTIESHESTVERVANVRQEDVLRVSLSGTPSVVVIGDTVGLEAALHK